MREPRTKESGTILVVSEQDAIKMEKQAVSVGIETAWSNALKWSFDAKEYCICPVPCRTIGLSDIDFMCGLCTAGELLCRGFSYIF